MIRYDGKVRALAACLSAVAGFVDATAFMALGGFFVSFMSGNTTRLGVGMAGAPGEALIAGGLIALFVAGVVLGSLAGRRAGARRLPVVLLLVAALLGCAAGAAAAGIPQAAIVAMALAMGAENAVFESEGEVRIGLTYMTGTLVKLGQRIADALQGGGRSEWLPYLLLWLGLAAGAAAGAASFPLLGLAGLWIPALATLLLCGVATAFVSPQQVSSG